MYTTHLETLTAIAKVLDGREWSAADLETIADHLRAAGFQIREPADHQCSCCGEDCPDGVDCCSDEFPEPGQMRETGQ